MGSTAKHQFTDEFKREAVALWETSGRMQTEVARELGIQSSMLRRWQRCLNGEPPRTAGGAVPASVAPPGSPVRSPADLASENAKLKRELERVKMEHDVLKRAIGIFAEVPR